MKPAFQTKACDSFVEPRNSWPINGEASPTEAMLTFDRCTTCAWMRCLLITLCVCLTCGGQVNSPPAGAMDTFKKELELARTAPDRDSRVEHLRQAVEYRPEDPRNLALEYRIGVLLCQHYDPKCPQPLRRREAVGVYEAVLKSYSHMDYYSSRPVDSMNDMQFMIPKAAVHLACLYRGLDGKEDKAREWTHFAMARMAETCERRKADWLSEPPPPEVHEDDPWGGPMARGKWEGRMQTWEERQRRAKEGDVFGPLEIAIAGAAVRQYGYSFGRQRPGEVAIPMGQIIRDFPGTPMAEIAEGHIERAKAMMLEGLDGNVLDGLPDDTVEAEAMKEADDVIVDETDTPVTSTSSENSVSENSVSPVAFSGRPKVAIGIGFVGLCVAAGALVWTWRKKPPVNP